MGLAPNLARQSVEPPAPFYALISLMRQNRIAVCLSPFAGVIYIAS